MPIRQYAAKRPSTATQRIPDTASAWGAVLAASDLTRCGDLSDKAETFAVDQSGSLRQVRTADPRALLRWNPDLGWQPAPGLPADIRDLLDLYLPVCGVSTRGTLTIGHLGQSLDGCIATRSGDSCYVTGRENILHLHRMRALCDAIIVGAETVARDDPRLTTRLVPGDNPVRVVLDPRRRLAAHHRVFSDGEAPTLLIHSSDQGDSKSKCLGKAEVLGMTADSGRGGLDLARVLQKLQARGLRRVFVEGGGVTVSAFLQAGLLDRLQVAVAPVIIGDGRRGLQLPATATMEDCQRPRSRVFRMGADVLFDCEPARSAECGSDDIPEASVG